MNRVCVCSSCGRIAKPSYTCPLCGATCCKKCFIISRNVCKSCAAGRKIMDH